MPPTKKPTRAELERAIAQADASVRRLEQVQITPIVHELNGCQIHVQDGTIGPAACKILTFIHQSGVVAYKATLPLAAAHDIATRLAAPPGIEIANGTPPAA